jgi:uncharacterized protein YjbI with pentapeptide repeats
MGKCKYGEDGNVTYYGYRKNMSIPYKCPHDTFLDGSFCVFHDNDLLQNNPDKVKSSFYELVNEAAQKAEPLLCIGFNLPDVNLSNKEFNNNVNFSRCRFTGKANFTGSKFNGEANFTGSKFNGEAYFSISTFKEIADFPSSTFTKKRLLKI